MLVRCFACISYGLVRTYLSYKLFNYVRDTNGRDKQDTFDSITTYVQANHEYHTYFCEKSAQIHTGTPADNIVILEDFHLIFKLS